MTKTLGLLADGGYITRTPDPVDRRQVVIALTDAAHRLLHEDRRRRDEWLAARLRGLTSDERAAVAAALPVLEVLAES
jgi:DNA-binding MarR family transcriptional regulator